MDAISKALSEVHYNIPMEILDLGFNDNPAHVNLSIDEVILSRVIRPRILTDCNLVGGIESYIELARCAIYDYSTFTVKEYVISVPKSITGGKSIITPIGLLIYNTIGSNEYPSGDVSPELVSAMNAAAMPANMSTARLELVGENEVLVMEPAISFMDGVLKCVLENNTNLSNINPRSYLSFSEMVVLGVKAYIYNHLIVKLGKGYIYNGHELGIVNDIISDYSTTGEEYRDYLNNTWSKVAFHNDKNRLGNLITGMI